jgi:hypothetical protein
MKAGHVWNLSHKPQLRAYLAEREQRISESGAAFRSVPGERRAALAAAPPAPAPASDLEYAADAALPYAEEVLKRWDTLREQDEAEFADDARRSFRALAVELRNPR